MPRHKQMLKRSHVEVAKKRRTCKFTSQSSSAVPYALSSLMARAIVSFILVKWVLK